MPATRTATASARCTSTRWRVSGHCSAPGCVRIAASRRKSCQSISASLSSCTTRAGAEKPCSAPLSLPWSGDVLHHPGSRQEPKILRRRAGRAGPLFASEGCLSAADRDRRQPRSRPYLDKPRGAAEPHHADVDAPLYPTDECVLKEGRDPSRSRIAALRAL